MVFPDHTHLRFCLFSKCAAIKTTDGKNTFKLTQYAMLERSSLTLFLISFQHSVWLAPQLMNVLRLTPTPSAIQAIQASVFVQPTTLRNPLFVKVSTEFLYISERVFSERIALLSRIVIPILIKGFNQFCLSLIDMWASV